MTTGFGVPRSGFVKDEIAKWYCNMPWRKFKALVLSLNPQCQRLINGEQCTQPATVVHHVVSPRVDSNKFLDWRNVLGVCAGHHMPSTGEPLNSANRYAITHGMFGETFDANEVIARLMPMTKPGSSLADGRAPSTIPHVKLDESVDYLAMFKRPESSQQHPLLETANSPRNRSIV